MEELNRDPFDDVEVGCYSSVATTPLSLESFQAFKLEMLEGKRRGGGDAIYLMFPPDMPLDLVREYCEMAGVSAEEMAEVEKMGFPIGLREVA